MNQLSKKSNHSLKKADFNTSAGGRLSFEQRAKLCTNAIAKQLLTICADKKSNLCVAADVTTKKELLRIADQLGPSICMLKTHIDIIEDFDWYLIEQLQVLAAKHNFLLFEDRKFADIGNTVKMQYAQGMYKIAEWAHIVNAHTVSGPGIIQGLKEIGAVKNRALLLLPQMSSAGNLASGEYTQKTVAMADDEFVIGFIAREKLSDDPRLIHCTPGVKIQEGGDGLDQQYLTPEQAIQAGSDIIIVGRGIIHAQDPAAMAQCYATAAWDAYCAIVESLIMLP